MTRLVKVFLFLLPWCVVYADGAEPPSDPFAGPEPFVVWIQTNPWSMVIGSDTPVLVVYENREVIFRDNFQSAGTYRHLTLALERFEKLRGDVFALGDFSTWKRNYNLGPNITDLPSTLLFVNLGNRISLTEVYGLMVHGTHLAAHTDAGSSGGGHELPGGVTALYNYLAGLQFEGASTWSPKFIEVMLWPYEYAPQESIHWPEEWPYLDSPMARQRGESYSLFLPGEKLGELRAFLKTRKPKGAVELGGKKWAVAYRFVFPSEPKWMRAFAGQ